MTYGMTLTSTDGFIAFSTNNRNYSFFEKRSITITQAARSNLSGTYGVFNTTVASTFGVPLVFYVPTSPGSGWSSANISSVSGSNYTFSFYTSDTQLSTTAQITVYIFLPQSNTATGYGMNVFDASGNTIFSTANRTLKISGYYITQSSSTYPTPPTLALTYGSIPSQYAICCTSFGGQTQAAGALIGSVLWVMGGKINSSTGVMDFGRTAATGATQPPVNLTFLLGSQYVPIINSALYD